MIEVVYKGEHKGDKNESQAALPKNIRQIGEGGNKNHKIYIEDYVVTYMNQIAEERSDKAVKTGAVLLGEMRSVGKCRYIFINGALSMERLDFDEETWDKLHQDIIEYFDGLEIVGWYLGEEESTLMVTEDVAKVHQKEFPGEDKVLILRDITEGESAVFVMEEGGLKKQQGYYIYYEKNIPMQEYMVAQNEGRVVEEQTEDKDEAIQNFRKISEEKKDKGRVKEKIKAKVRENSRRALKSKEHLTTAETVVKEEALDVKDKIKEISKEVNKDIKKEIKKEKEGRIQPLSTKLLYAASSFLVMTVLIIGITLINNYDKMKNMEVALNGLSEALTAQRGDGVENYVSSEAAAAMASIENQKNKADSEKQGNEMNTDNKAQSSEKEESNKTAEAAAEQETLKTAESMTESKNGKSAEAATERETAKTAESMTEAVTDKTAEMGGAVTSAQENNENDRSDVQNQQAKETLGRASYIVKDGDTIAIISEMYYGTLDKVDEICSLNGITDKNRILPGQKIVLP